jgi:hypothetical protein
MSKPGTQRKTPAQGAIAPRGSALVHWPSNKRAEPQTDTPAALSVARPTAAVGHAAKGSAEVRTKQEHHRRRPRVAVATQGQRVRPTVGVVGRTARKAQMMPHCSAAQYIRLRICTYLIVFLFLYLQLRLCAAQKGWREIRPLVRSRHQRSLGMIDPIDSFGSVVDIIERKQSRPPVQTQDTCVGRIVSLVEEGDASAPERALSEADAFLSSFADVASTAPRREDLLGELRKHLPQTMLAEKVIEAISKGTVGI